MNKVILIGRLVKDPELTTTTNGVSLSRFTLAVNRKYKNDDGNYDTDFFNCVAWRTLGETCHKYLRKGLRVAIEGEIQIRTYEVEGSKRYATDIVINNFDFLESKQEKEETQVDLTPINDDDLPF